MALTGNEVIYVLGQDAEGRPAATEQQTTTGAIAALAEAFDSTDMVITALNTVGAGTITAAGIVGGATLRGGSQSATPFTDTTATAALIIAALPSYAQVGQSFVYRYINNTDAVATIAGGSSVTVSGITTVQPNMVVEFLVTYATSSTVTVAGLSTAMYNPANALAISGGEVVNGGAVFNENSADVDFRVESNGNANAIFVDAGNDRVGIFNASPAVELDVTGAITASTTITGATVAGIGTTQTYRTSSALTKNASTAYSDITGLTGIPLVAGATYKFRCVLPSTVAGGTEGIKYCFNYTTATLTSIESSAFGMTASAVAVQHTTTTTTQTDLFTQAAVVLLTIIEGTMVVDTGGTMAVQMAQNTSGATDTIALVGGTIEMSRIA